MQHHLMVASSAQFSAHRGGAFQSLFSYAVSHYGGGDDESQHYPYAADLLVGQHSLCFVCLSLLVSCAALALLDAADAVDALDHPWAYQPVFYFHLGQVYFRSRILAGEGWHYP
jgi:hypothetical protein